MNLTTEVRLSHLWVMQQLIGAAFKHNTTSFHHVA